MKLRLFIAALLFVLPLPAAATPQAVERAFQDYKVAVLNGDGVAAAALVTQQTYDYYGQIADHALPLDQGGLNKLHVMDRMAVLQLRYQMSRAQLESMSGAEIVAYAVDQGWIGKDGVSRLQVGPFTVNGDTASAAALGGDGQETSLRLHFVKEGDRWRLDLMRMLLVTRVAIAQAIQQTGMSENDFILYALEAMTGRRPGLDIWSPPS